jgi:EEF1A lysine methyltransferase 1
MTVAEFLSQNHEDGDYNQYWYSEQTITKIVEALIENNGKIAFLSTPSLYFSLPDEIKSRAYVFDVSRRM